MIAAEDLLDLKAYMHVDHDDDDLLIMRLWSIAEQYIGADAHMASDSGFLCKAALVLQWYDGAPLPPGAQQLINQLKKLINVKKVEVLEPDCIKRELMLIKIQNKREDRTDIHFACDAYRAKVVDYTNDGMCIEVTGDPSKIDAFIEIMKPYGIIEMCRTGIVALERGKETLLGK